MNPNAVTEQIIGAAIEVHRALGPGLLESLYEECMSIELQERGLPFERQRPVMLHYRGHRVGEQLRLDLVVGAQVVVELKSVEYLLPVHEAQLLSYLRLSGCPLGLLINFRVPVLKSGIRRLINGFVVLCVSVSLWLVS